ncbi:nucleoside deaminase [Jiella endophytica]|uniref:tRNA-specific adenosine deaminase n=2 Tax=Jiella endophytica TaxID=2558362 RepID=A0A4Y8RCK1_9HYPH|nr:nucleoside deaminase [Jiella endophytica]
MERALEEATRAAARGEVPVGAVVSRDGEVIAAAGNETLARFDPTAHAEIVAIRLACEALGSQRLTGCDLHVTLEPCAMCAAAISFARIRRLYFGAGDEKGGAVEHGPRFYSQPTCHHAPEVYSGLSETASAEMLRRFFDERR